MARELTDPFECGTLGRCGWTSQGGAFYVGLTYAAKDLNGNGGTYSVGTTNATAKWIRSTAFQNGSIAHGFMSCHFMAYAYNYSMEIGFFARAVDIANIYVPDSTQQFLARRSSTQIGAGAAYNEGSLFRWSHLEAEVFIHDTLGIFRLWVDGVLQIDFSGDTDPGTGGVFDRIRLWGKRFFIDDLIVNSITMSYDGGSSGAPLVGETITGAAGGTAVITSVLTGNATAGILLLQQWNGTAFVNNEVLTSSGTLVALVDAPTADYANGFEPHSGRVGNEYVVLLKPIGNGASSDLAGSDGNSVDNYLLVNDIPPVTTDYVDGSATGEKDTYDPDTSTNLPAATELSAISVVAPQARMKSNMAGLNNARMVVRDGGVDYYTDDVPLNVDHRPVIGTFSTQPDGSGAWDHATLVAAGFETGVEVKT